MCYDGCEGSGIHGPRPARAGPVRNDPDSADRRGASRIRLACAQLGARTAPAPTPARARTQMRAIKGRSDAGPALSNASRTKGAAAPHAPHRPRHRPLPPARKPSAAATMIKHELTCHSMTCRNSLPVLPASSRMARSGPTPIQPTGKVRPASASRAQSGARTAPAPTRARARTQMRAIKGLRCRAGAPDEREPNERSRHTPCPSSSLPPPPTLPDSHIGFRWHPARPPARLHLTLPPSPALAKAGGAPALFVAPAKAGAHP